MSQLFSIFSPQQWQVLRALARYRFLTVDQMLHLGISKSAASLRDKTLFALRYHDCIRSEKIGSFLPDIHHLTPNGQAILNQIEPWHPVSAPSNKRTPFSALFAQHRFAQVDFHIDLTQWAEKRGDIDILLAQQDFIRISRDDRGGIKSSTELCVPTLAQSVIPDGIFAIKVHTGKIAVYLVEVHRSTQTKAVTEQLENYFEVIKQAVVQDALGYPVHPIICSIHRQSSVLENVKKRLIAMPKFESFKRNFVFHPLDNLNLNFTGGWHFADEQPANPFPSNKPPKE